MEESDKERIISRYNNRLKKYGPTIDALASGNAERRNIRFEVLKNIGIQNDDRVLDLGCGFGDLYEYLSQNGLRVNYTGIDINPELIAHARKRFPSVDFRVLDIQNEDPGKFDYVLSTSCFNLKLLHQDNYKFIQSILSSCYKVAEKGVAVDFLTSYVDFKGNPEEAFYYEPEKVFAIGKNITKRVCLRHDYPLFEFCIYLYPDFEGWLKK